MQFTFRFMFPIKQNDDFSATYCTYHKRCKMFFFQWTCLLDKHVYISPYYSQKKFVLSLHSHELFNIHTTTFTLLLLIVHKSLFLLIKIIGCRRNVTMTKASDSVVHINVPVTVTGLHSFPSPELKDGFSIVWGLGHDPALSVGKAVRLFIIVHFLHQHCGRTPLPMSSFPFTFTAVSCTSCLCDPPPNPQPPLKAAPLDSCRRLCG